MKEKVQPEATAMRSPDTVPAYIPVFMLLTVSLVAPPAYARYWMASSLSDLLGLQQHGTPGRHVGVSVTFLSIPCHYALTVS